MAAAMWRVDDDVWRLPRLTSTTLSTISPIDCVVCASVATASGCCWTRAVMNEKPADVAPKVLPQWSWC